MVPLQIKPVILNRDYFAPNISYQKNKEDKYMFIVACRGFGSEGATAWHGAPLQQPVERKRDGSITIFLKFKYKHFSQLLTRYKWKYK